MFATCLFCNNSLGANDALEHFPVGRRLAFDSAAGRLWVICGNCQRWNLSPLETRWEAIEEAERAFRDAKLRMSTANIGLARLTEGLDLVRIGAPQRPEFAAWRYGEQFARRHRKTMMYTAAVIAPSMLYVGTNLLHLFGAAGAVVFPSAVMGATVFGMNAKARHLLWVQKNRPSIRIRDNDGRLLRLTAANAARATIFPAGKELDWQLTVPHVDVAPPTTLARMLHEPEVAGYEHAPHTITGKAAERALATLLPKVNGGGGKKQVVNDAVDIVSSTTDLGHMLRGGASRGDSNKYFRLTVAQTYIQQFPAHIRLAMEMMVHEESERRAMDGELHELEARWRDADAIAKIADEMLLPQNIEQQVEELRERNSG